MSNIIVHLLFNSNLFNFRNSLSFIVDFYYFTEEVMLFKLTYKEIILLNKVFCSHSIIQHSTTKVQPFQLCHILTFSTFSVHLAKGWCTLLIFEKVFANYHYYPGIFNTGRHLMLSCSCKALSTGFFRILQNGKVDSVYLF